AGEGDAEEGFAGDVDGVVGDVGEDFAFVGVAVAPVADCIHAGGDDGVGVDFGGRFSGQEVAGDLLFDKFVVGQVVVEGADDPVAITPRFGDVAVAADAARVLGIGVAHDVEPVAAPVFAVMW